ncbi:uncharacterized protein LOC129592329 [Paramacrobiotus metropolitanus]|uniref:uncharacterized protein LOC129592329 n=1 Tax=Paramacrobiotus metropolitanus TaxID=2943436 RepID=UPI002445ADCD|nr:uncharacterized protein LOC129592329 [Paramacrobiotus metropolitanus]
MVTFSANIAYNAMPIEDTLNGVARIGTAVYPLASPRLMTPVCWDTNVVLTFRGRRLTIHAVEDISNYTGQKDLRYNIMPEPFYMTRAERRAEFEKLHGYPCTCRKCSPQYDADINPLKCVNMGCPNRIPSDDRALQPCSECGALNKERLVRFRRFLQQHENVKIRFRKELHVPMMMDLCKEMDAVDILQPDAHIRYVCGWGLPRTLYDDNRFEEGWKMMQEFIVCARNIYPKYEVSRAIVLSLAGMSAAIALKKLVVQRAGQVPAAEKEQLQAMLDTACPVILNYSHESADIFVTLYGEFSKQAMERRDMLTRTIALVHDIKKVFRNSK